MPNPILISLSPNTQSDDLRLVWKVLLSQQTWKDQSSNQDLAENLNQLFLNYHTHLTSSGRAAIYHGLKASGIGQGDQVIVQPFTCLAVINSILWTGAKPIYADIDPHTFNLEPDQVKTKITNKTKAILVQHTFGIPGPSQELSHLADQNNLLLIEDLAHALGSDIKPLGDLLILSFGRDKTISSVYGGALLSKQVLAPLPLQPAPISWTFQQLLHPIIMSLAKPVYFTAKLGPLMIRLSQILSLLSKAVSSQEKQGGMPAHINYAYSPTLAKLANHQIKKLDKFTHKRQAIAQQYQASLPNQPTLNPQANYLRYPLRVNNQQELLNLALDNQMMLGDWYQHPITPTNTANTHYIKNSCPNAEQASREIINLPTYPLMTDQQVTQVINFIKNSAELI